MAKKTLTCDLSVKSIKQLQSDLEKYKTEITYKCQLLAERLAERGVQIARLKIAEYDAIYTGELLASINYEYGGVVKNGSTWIIYTDCPWAKFVEFGTGLIGKNSPHPDTSIVGWKYDVNDHGESGWYYFKDGEWHWTKGMPSRPFMYETDMQLIQEVTKVAKEVFGK